MIRVAVMYPQSKDKSFDLEYFKNKHMKLVKEKLGPMGLVGAELDSGISGIGGSPAPYFAIGYMVFETLEAFKSAIAKFGQELAADTPNYTNVEPLVQISDFLEM